MQLRLDLPIPFEHPHSPPSIVPLQPYMTITIDRAHILQFTRYLVGITVVSVGATLGIQCALGASPYDALLVTLTDRFGTPFWLTAWIMHAVWIAVSLRAGSRVRLGMLLHSLAFGPIMGFTLSVIPEASTTVESILYLGSAVVLMAIGFWIYLSAAFVSGVVDNLFNVVGERGGWRPASLRTGFDLVCCAVAWIGSGPVGLGTVVIAFGVGPLLGLFSSGLVRPASWRGIGLGSARVPEDELVDTSEYVLGRL